MYNIIIHNTVIIIIVTIFVYTDERPNDDVGPFQLVLEISLKNEHKADNNTQFINYGYTREDWERDGLQLAWKKEDLKDDLCVTH